MDPHRNICHKISIFFFPHYLVALHSILFHGTKFFVLLIGYFTIFLVEDSVGFLSSKSAFTWKSFFQMVVSKKNHDLQKENCWSFFQPVRVKHGHFLSLLSSERLRAASTMEPWNQTKAGLWEQKVLVLIFQASMVWKSQLEGDAQVLLSWCLHMIVHTWLQASSFCSLWLKLKARVCSQRNFTDVNHRWTILSYDLKSRSPQFYCWVCCRFLASSWAGLRSYEFHFPAWKAEDSVSFLRAAWFL